MIFHITSRKNWKTALATGDYRVESLAGEGFIHCSTDKQVLPVAEKFYSGQRELVLLLIEPTLLSSPLIWEPPSDGTPPPGVPTGDPFPHIYGPINLSAVVKVLDLEQNADNQFILPTL